MKTTISAVVAEDMTITTNDLNWIFFGFRLGQLMDVCSRKSNADDEDVELISSLIDNVAISIPDCIPASDRKELGRSGIRKMKIVWKNRDSLARDAGADKPFDLVYKLCLGVPATIRHYTDSTSQITGFEFGVELGRSSGWCGAFFDSEDKEEVCWGYRERPTLMAKLGILGETLDRLTGFPDTDDPEQLFEFISTLPPNSQKLERYPHHRWGWSFIEDALVDLRLTLPPPPTNNQQEDGKSVDKLSGQTDTGKKSQKQSKRRFLDKHARACIKEFKEYQRTGEPQPMKRIVRNYVEENKDVSESTLYKRLNDNSDQWK